MKLHGGVISALLKEQPYYPTEKSDSRIIFGNRDAKTLITILTNPHCGPCGKMHTRVEKLLESGVQNFCIQYIFSSFNENQNISNKFLIAAYLNNIGTDRALIYEEWFTKGKFNNEAFFARFSFDLKENEVENEFQKHQKWISETKLELTPTILIDGYKLPGNYKIEDFRFITDLDIKEKSVMPQDVW